MVDLLPTITSVVGVETPNDRIIDGIDQSDFLLGKQEKSNREGFHAFNGDEMFAYKWGNWKMHLIELNSMFAAPARLNMPTFNNLMEDPKEQYPIDQADISGACVFPVIFEKIVDFQRHY